MPLFYRRPLAAFICCLFAGMQTAQAAINTARAVETLPPAEPARPASLLDGDLYELAANDPQPLGLRMERKFKSPGPKPRVVTLPAIPGLPMEPAPVLKKDVQPVFLVADHIEGHSEDAAVADGDVELRRSGTLVLADHVTYWPLEDEVEAKGNVRLQQGDDEVSGPYMRLKLTEQIGHIDDADYRFKKEVLNRFYRPVAAVSTAVGTSVTTSGTPLMLSVPGGYGLPTSAPARRPSEGYGHAKKIEFEGENQISLSEATYSTCRPGETDWYVKARAMHLDYDREIGSGEDATLYFKDTPIFYMPSGSFSLNHQPKSGFLPANFAASTKNGLDLTLPFYWHLAPNYDLTLYPREMSKRGFQLGAEARYGDYNYMGSTRLEYLPNDDLADRRRYAYQWTHSHNLGQGLTAQVNWNGVSDDRYWQDFSSRLLQTSQVQLPRQLALSYAPNTWWAASVQTLRYQTLQPDPGTVVTRPYFLEPQINFSGRKALASSLDLNLVGQYSRFSHPTQVEGDRMVAYPQLSLPYVAPSMLVIPKIGLHASQYSLDRQLAGAPSSISRVVPVVSLDGTLYFEREASFAGYDFVQTLEPRLYYVYVPYRDQSKIPVFDTSLADFNFAQIFTENRYSGYDRINDTNQLTAAVTSRFLDATTGAERFKAMVGQRYYFSDQRVSLSSIYGGAAEVLRQKDFSNFLAAFNGLILPKTYLDAAWEYNYHTSQNERASVGMRYQPDYGRVLSASYRFTRDPVSQQTSVEQVDIAGQWPLSSRWYAVGRYNYSVRDKQALEVIGGLEYNAGCWAARGVVQRLEAIGGSPNTTLFFQLELSDFANIGSNPIQLLRRTIPGYGKINEMPAGGSLLTSP